jgi:membrane protein involved in colicin uptake
VADVTLDADHAAENATAAKTLADITAAEEASASPIAHHVDRPVADQPAPESTAPPEADDVMSDGNSGDASPQ